MQQEAIMKNTNYLSSWVKRFLLEYLISIRNLSKNTQQSYIQQTNGTYETINVSYDIFPFKKICAFKHLI